MEKISNLQTLMHTCVEIGYMRGQIDLTPASGRIRKKDAEELLKRHGFEKVLLSRWVREGLVRENKGEKNSPVWYSVTEIMETIGAIQYKKCLI